MHDKSRLRALIVSVLAHNMQIQVAHAVCKQGQRGNAMPVNPTKKTPAHVVGGRGGRG